MKELAPEMTTKKLIHIVQQADRQYLDFSNVISYEIDRSKTRTTIDL